jgi:nucleoid-associated protein YgaU
MSKEIKVGLAIVGALGVALVSMTAMRMRAKQTPAAVEAQDAQQALTALKEEKARMGGEPEKPGLFSLGDANNPAADPARDGGGERHHERHDPFARDTNPMSSDPTAAASPMGGQIPDAPSSIVGDRYGAPAAVVAEERREERKEERKLEREAAAGDPVAEQKLLERQEVRAADPFQQGGQGPMAGQGPMNNPMAANPSAFGQPPQATLADGIAPAGDQQPPLSPYGSPPPGDPLTRSAGDVRLDPNPDGGDPARHHHHEKRDSETLQTAGETPVPGDPRYGDYRNGQKANPYQAADVARERAVMKEMRRDEDRYRQQTNPAATAGTPQYDIYGRDIRSERDDPQPGSGGQIVPDANAARLTDDPLGRRTDNLAPDGTDAAPPPVDGKYRVAPGDNFWTISQKAYGNGSYFKALEEHNRERFPNSDKLPVGQEVRVPPVRELEEQYPDLCPRPRTPAGERERGAMNVSTREDRARTYKVQDGDTLFDIARDQLGKASRWNEIYELNRAQLGNDFNFLAPGTDLILPDNRQSRDPLTTQARQPQTR